MRRPVLTLFHKGEAILREALDGNLSIGSGDECDIGLTESVATHHARIEQHGDDWLIIEEDGAVYVNGARSRGGHILKNGDVLDLGGYRAQIHQSTFERKTLTATAQGEEVASDKLPFFQVLAPYKKRFRRTHLTIGRSSSCDIVVDNPFASSKHAEIFFHQGQYHLRDLHSRNGTILNDQPVTEKVMPHSGTIRIGELALLYEIEILAPQDDVAIQGVPLPFHRGKDSIDLIVGSSPAFKSMMAKMAKIANNDDSVLLLGETGVGKDLLAHFLHAENKRRKDHPFIVVNCASIPPNLADSQLFGHVRGAFTGATEDHKGFLQQAHRGTLFLDEIGELPLESQARLLRIMEEGLVRPLGSYRDAEVSVRFVFATNRNLAEEVAQKKFRQDLLERFDWSIQVPSLKERAEDIPMLLNYFLQKNSPHPMKFKPEVPLYLQSQEWPGNIRALHRAVRRAITNAVSRGSDTILLSDFEMEMISKYPRGWGLTQNVRKEKRALLEDTLKECGGNISETSKRLGISRVTIHQWIKEDKIDLSRFKN